MSEIYRYPVSRLVLCVALTMVLALLAACTLPDVGPPPTFAVPPSTPAALEGGNLLVIREPDGNLAMLNPKTGKRIGLTDDASANVVYGQPVWSPAAAELAWVRTEMRGTTLEGEVLVADTTGNVKMQIETTFPPFYMYWNPQGTRLSLLGNWFSDGNATMALNVIDTESSEKGVPKLVDVGAPFYYVWAPDGERLVVHRDAHLVWIGSPQVPQDLTANSAPFGAPAWLGESEDVVFAESRDGVATLLRRNLITDAEEILTWYQGSHLALYPDVYGRNLAVIETPEGININAFGPLFVYSFEQGTVEQITSGPVIAVFWSPNGHGLLFWEANMEGNVGSFNLRFWNGEEILEVALVDSPPEFLRRFLFFSDQYARSHTLWSADSQMVAFATVGPSGNSEIFVQEMVAGTPADFVAYGDLVFWSRHSSAD